MKNVIVLFLSLLTLQSCASEINSSKNDKINLPQTDYKNQFDENRKTNVEVAYFASGCFWCVEAIYESVRGVVEVESGYSGGIVKNPTYKQICTGTLKHAESVKVIYDPEKVSFSTLVDVFFNRVTHLNLTT